jgi:hypothetical protein
MQPICSGLRLIVQLMHSTECFGIWIHPLASKGPNEDAESNDSVRGQLMKINFKILQHFSYHLIKREPQSGSEKTLENNYFIIFRRSGGLFSGKSDQFLFNFSEVTQLHHHGHVVTPLVLPKALAKEAHWVLLKLYARLESKGTQSLEAWLR